MALDPLDTVALTTCTDQDLLTAQADVVARRRRIEAEHAAIAGEIARRSAPDTGMAGLAQRSGDAQRSSSWNGLRGWHLMKHVG